MPKPFNDLLWRFSSAKWLQCCSSSVLFPAHICVGCNVFALTLPFNIYNKRKKAFTLFFLIPEKRRLINKFRIHIDGPVQCYLGCRCERSIERNSTLHLTLMLGGYDPGIQSNITTNTYTPSSCPPLRDKGLLAAARFHRAATVKRIYCACADIL